MPGKVDAVIAALKVVLADVLRSNNYYQDTRDLNRWINQLPGAWFGRWNNLKLHGDMSRHVVRTDFVRHVRATLAYLEANRDYIASSRPWWFSWGKLEPVEAVQAEPIDADFQDMPQKLHTLPVARSRTKTTK